VVTMGTGHAVSGAIVAMIPVREIMTVWLVSRQRSILYQNTVALRLPAASLAQCGMRPAS
jgi:hypothetical protein